MSEVELHFGALCVIIRDDKKDVSEIRNLAHQTLLELIPEAEKVLSKGNNIHNGCGEDCDFEEEEMCSLDQPPGKSKDTMNRLYG